MWIHDQNDGIGCVFPKLSIQDFLNVTNGLVVPQHVKSVAISVVRSERVFAMVNRDKRKRIKQGFMTSKVLLDGNGDCFRVWSRASESTTRSQICCDCSWLRHSLSDMDGCIFWIKAHNAHIFVLNT